MHPFKVFFVFVGLFLTYSVFAADDFKQLDLGRKIYRQGLLSSGKTLTAFVQGDVEIDGHQATCTNCHRRSGLGSSEGRIQTLPITADLLYQPRTKGRRISFMRQAVSGSQSASGARPAYTDKSLKVAIRIGVDASGHQLNQIMPRFELDDKDMDALVAYIKSLSSNSSPGVDDEFIHFATIITDDVSDEKSQAMLDVLNVYFDAKNAGTRHEDKRAKHAPWHRDWKYQSYRKWKLHVWRLTGPQNRWKSQLEALYQKQAVFALVSGISNSSWQPIHQFCEQNEIPSLFPITDLPVISNSDFYTMYFSKGIELDVSAIFELFKSLKGRKKPRLLQVYRNDQLGKEFSKVTQKIAKKLGFLLEDFVIPANQLLDNNIWSNINGANKPEHVLLWLNDQDLEAIKYETPLKKTFYISATLSPGFSQSLSSSMQAVSYIENRFMPSNAIQRNLLRTNLWLKKNKIKSNFTRVQANTFFAMTSLNRAIMHLRDKFSRDYLLELLEHTVEKSLVTSLYPRLALGAGQRYAAKGAYVYKFTNSKESLDASSWWVPD